MAQTAIDASDLRKFTKQIRKASEKTGRALTKGEKRAATVVADRAKELMAAHSPKAAATITPFAQGDRVGIQIGNDEVPLARLLEVGNHSDFQSLRRSARTGRFQHPVFATGDRSDWHWNNKHPQKMHPAVQPAIAEKFGEFQKALAEEVTEVFKDVDLYFGI
jgi:hypothetical protein